MPDSDDDLIGYPQPRIAREHGLAVEMVGQVRHRGVAVPVGEVLVRREVESNVRRGLAVVDVRGHCWSRIVLWTCRSRTQGRFKEKLN